MLVIFIILLMPFHAFLTVWGASVVGHYTALRLWKEVLLLVCGVAALFLLATDHKIRTHTLSRRLVWLIGIYGGLIALTGLWALHRHTVTPKALGYGAIVDSRFLIFFLVSWAISLRLARLRSHWQWIVLWPSAIVILFGLLQIFVLPADFLKHFGYSASTIPPYETINHNAHYPRIIATLRGANPLGAYLLIPISFLAVLLLRRKIQPKQIVLLLGAIICLFFSFSRSAWLGGFISLGVAIGLSIHSKQAKRWLLICGSGLIVVVAGLFLVLHNNARFQNFAFHTEDRSAVKHSSNQGHFSAVSEGLHDIEHEPLGEGTGTAGQASVYNTGHPARIAENYYLQVGQEVGVLGLVLFLLINVGVGYLLWIRRADSLALALFASFVGLFIVNMLSHAWGDDTLAYIWWGLAGIAMAPDLKEAREAIRDGKAK